MLASTLLLSLVPVVLAQYGDPPPAGASSPAAAAATSSSAPSSTAASVPSAAATIVAGGTPSQIGFAPNNVTVPAGSIVEFQFMPPAHSVIQTSFESPCNYTNSSGFYSGPVTTASGVNTMVFQVTVNDTNPIWFFCGAPTHCELGMVGVINPPTSGPNTIDAFTTAAKAIGSNTGSLILPANMQGGVILDSSPTSSPPSTSSTSPSSAAIESRGTVQWGLLALTGAVTVVAAGFGSLLL